MILLVNVEKTFIVSAKGVDDAGELPHRMIVDFGEKHVLAEAPDGTATLRTNIPDVTGPGGAASFVYKLSDSFDSLLEFLTR